MSKTKFSWQIDKIVSYSPSLFEEDFSSFQTGFASLCRKKYHDEHDIYVPFQNLLRRFFKLRQADRRVGNKAEYIRNRRPKSFVNDCDDLPDFTFRKQENFFFEIKNRDALDKRGGRSKTPHEQTKDYLGNCVSESFGVLLNLEEARFYLKTSGGSVRWSQDYSLDEQGSNGLCETLYSLFHPESALSGIEVYRLANFVQSKSVDAVTTEAVQIIIDHYFKMLAATSQVHAATLKHVVCRIAFIAVVESIGLIKRGTSHSILEAHNWSRDSYKDLFRIFNRGNEKYEIPKFNGKLFQSEGRLSLPTSATPHLFACVKALHKLLSDTDAQISDEMPGRILEVLYEVDHRMQKLSKQEIISDAQKRITDRMEKGTFYTGSVLSELAAKELVPNEADFLNLKVLDLCAGSGSLLLPVIKYISNRLFREQRWPYYRALEHVIENNIFAIDKDPTAIELIRLNMAIDTVRFGVPLIDSSGNLRQADALKTKTSEVPSSDLLISNPPYLAWEKISQEDCGIDSSELRRGSELFKYADKPDLWYFFFEKALRFARNGARLAFIVSDKWMSAEGGSDIRRLFKETVTLERVIQIGYPVFPNSTSCPSIIIVRNEPPEDKHKIIIDSYRAEGKRETVRAIESHTPIETWKLSQTEFNHWTEICVPFANDLEAAKSRYETDHLPKLREIGLEIQDPRMQSKISESQVKPSKSGEYTVPVMAGRNFGQLMGFTKRSHIPPTWTYLGNPALLIHQKGQFIETEVVSECPAGWKTITVIGCSKPVPKYLYQELERYLKSDYFRKWYMMRYSTTWTQGGYQFIKAVVEVFPVPRKLSREILKHTRPLIQYKDAA